MNIDFDAPILDFKGTPVPEGMTVGSCAIAALQHLYQGEEITPDVKVKRFKLAVRIAQADLPLSLTADDVSVIKTVVGKYWNPLVVGRVFEAIDPESMRA